VLLDSVSSLKELFLTCDADYEQVIKNSILPLASENRLHLEKLSLRNVTTN